MGDIGPPGATLPGERGEKGIPGPAGQYKSLLYSCVLFYFFNIGNPGPYGATGPKGEPGMNEFFDKKG
jgi:hypothetical protein